METSSACGDICLPSKCMMESRCSISQRMKPQILNKRVGSRKDTQDPKARKKLCSTRQIEATWLRISTDTGGAVSGWSSGSKSRGGWLAISFTYSTSASDVSWPNDDRFTKRLSGSGCTRYAKPAKRSSLHTGLSNPTDKTEPWLARRQGLQAATKRKELWIAWPVRGLMRSTRICLKSGWCGQVLISSQNCTTICSALPSFKPACRTLARSSAASTASRICFSVVPACTCCSSKVSAPSKRVVKRSNTSEIPRKFYHCRADKATHCPSK